MGPGNPTDETSGHSGEPAALSCRALFPDYQRYSAIALAVSGGADSVALVCLVRQWLDERSGTLPHITVVTVDHKLRPSSAREAAWVGELARKLGFDHQILEWRGAKPLTGIQVAARNARYDLMADFCRSQGILALATAHNADDQAETLLMRLKRGSGVDGLAAMEPVSRREGIEILRPLLDVPRFELEAYLKSIGQSWKDDPSNRNADFERVRIRRALRETSGLGLTPEAIVLSSRRLARARDALEASTAAFLRASLEMSEAGFGHLDCAVLLAQPDDIALRSLIRMAAAFGGRGSSLRLARAEAALSKLKDGAPGLTLAGCHFAVRKGRLLAVREFGRMPRQPVRVEAGRPFVWDNRFKIEWCGDNNESLMLRPLGPDGVKAVKARTGGGGTIPRAAMLGLPSFWRGGVLQAAPLTAFEPPNADIPVPPTAAFLNRGVLFPGSDPHNS